MKTTLKYIYSKKMITIRINGREVKIYEFDDGETILRRYVLVIGKKAEKGRETLTLPSYLRFNPEPIIFKNNEDYHVTDIRNELKTLSLERLSKKGVLAKLHARYPLIDRDSVALLWFVVNGYLEMAREQLIREFIENNFKYYLQPIQRRIIINSQIIYDDLTKYIKEVSKRWDEIAAESQHDLHIYETLQKIEPVETTTFDLEETIEETFFRLPNEESLYDVFDAMVVSKEIPYIILLDGKDQTFIKVFSDIPPAEEWIEQQSPSSDSTRGIIFYVLDSPMSKVVYSKIEKFYSIGLWTEANSVRLSLKLNSDITSEQLRRKVIESVSPRIELIIEETMQMSVKGKFSIKDHIFNRGLFSDLIMNDPVTRSILFMDEKERSSLEKSRFSFYYRRHHCKTCDLADSLTITMTPFVTTKGKWVDIRVSRGATLEQINSFIFTFRALFGLYLSRKDEIAQSYKDLFSSSVSEFKKFDKKTPESKEDRKTGDRLIALKQHNPNAFTDGYSSKCQPRHRQPYLIDGAAGREELKSELKKIGGDDLAREGLLNWPHGSEDWYACFPRDEDDQDKRYIWPGVVKQKESARNANDYPYLPCCFINNQYSKRGGTLLKYLSTVTENDNEVEIDPSFSFDRPLGEKKMAPRGRFAELPYSLQIIVDSCGYKMIEDKNKMFFPILRHGVVNGPDSFVHCMEKATDIKDRYAKLSLNQKRQKVKDVLATIASADNFTIGRQELFDLSEDEIRDHLVTEGAYIDPDLYVSVFEKFYRSNIILFQVDPDRPDGDLVIPHHASAYLRRALDPSLKTVVIVKFAIPKEWRYQCELVVEYRTESEGGLLYAFPQGPFIEKLNKIVQEINTVYITSTTGRYHKYTPPLYR